MRLGDFSLLPTDVEHVGKLPKHSVNILAAFESFGNYEDVSNSLGIPLGTVKSRLHRARAKVLASRAETEAAA